MGRPGRNRRQWSRRRLANLSNTLSQARAGHHRRLNRRAALGDGGPAAPRLDAARRRIIADGFTAVDYVELRDAETLAGLAAMADRPARLLAAAHLGPVRLIDNVPVPNAGREGAVA